MNFRIPCLCCSGMLVMLASCTSDFKDLRTLDASPCSIDVFKPSIDYALYSASVDILNKHMSGLVVVKTMPEQATRVVFQSEMGLTYFDFEWTKEGSFLVKSVMERLDKEVIITALRKDFELMMMNTVDTAQAKAFTDGKLQYTRFPEDKEYIYAISDTSCISLVKMERASRRKAKVDLYLYSTDSVPDSVWIQHQQFQFNISLSRIPQ